MKRLALAVPVLLLSAWLLGTSATIHAKAILAQWLIAWSWETQQNGVATRPWPWADTWPVARLAVPGLAVEQYVLYGTSGQALAFGPGLDPASATPGARGVTLLAGHRDTHFRWLAAIGAGDRITLTGWRGNDRLYRVSRLRVLDSREGPLQVSIDDGLVLVTCYPFDALNPGGPLRYVVEARPVEL